MGELLRHDGPSASQPNNADGDAGQSRLTDPSERSDLPVVYWCQPELGRRVIGIHSECAACLDNPERRSTPEQSRRAPFRAQNECDMCLLARSLAQERHQNGLALVIHDGKCRATLRMRMTMDE